MDLRRGAINHGRGLGIEQGIPLAVRRKVRNPVGKNAAHQDKALEQAGNFLIDGKERGDIRHRPDAEQRDFTQDWRGSSGE